MSCEDDARRYWGFAQDEAYRAARECSDAKIAAENARNYALRAKESATDLKKVEINVMEQIEKCMLRMSEAELNMEKYCSKVQSLRNEVVSAYRSILKEKEMAEQRERVRRLDEARNKNEPVKKEAVIELVGTTYSYCKKS